MGISPRLWQAAGAQGRRKKIEGFPEAPGPPGAPQDNKFFNKDNKFFITDSKFYTTDNILYYGQ